MGMSEWIALGVAVLSLVGATGRVTAKLGAVSAKVEMLGERLDAMTGSIHRLFELWDSRPCERNTASLSQLHKRVESVEERLGR
ncbi:hypothetical protein LCGC14_2151310 [marine sediment metagenome]|uniref:Uncharacterized protein n=1 Tax=marine sediment metagenome TaxID=412755 RepID=A0A0F9DVE6_9ZZZZ